MTSTIRQVQTPYFQHDGRGPVLQRWLYDHELFFPNTNQGFAPFVGQIIGAHYALLTPAEPDLADMAWVIFHGLQVIQIVPEEVHSYWHREAQGHAQPAKGAWVIDDSPWLHSFNPRHLAKQQHIVLEFYDVIVEVLCEELVFGPGPFDLETIAKNDRRFARAYFRLADAQERAGDYLAAIRSFQNYLEQTLDTRSISYVQRRIEALQQQQAE